MATPFIAANATECVLQVIQGCVQLRKCKLEEKNFEFILISRRSCRRCGLRYQMRGVDDEGDVANFVETEQIVLYEKEQNSRPHLISFVQIRGSSKFEFSVSVPVINICDAI